MSLLNVSRLRRATKAVLMLLASGLVGSIPVFAEDAALVGAVRDSSGGALAGAAVRVRHVETNTLTATFANDQGDYRIPLARVGVYEVSGEKEGFRRTVVSDVTVQIGQTARVDLTLQVGQVAESVTVEAKVPLIHSETSALAVRLSPSPADLRLVWRQVFPRSPGSRA